MPTNRFHRALIVLALAVVPAEAATWVHLRCEDQTDPAAVETRRPQLSWMMESGRQGDGQTAYQVLVASSADRLDEDKADLWNSGKCESDQSIHIKYAGTPLGSRTRCFWKMRGWDRAGQPGPWSAPAHWTMGLLQPDDWTAKWITWQPAPEPGQPSDPHGSVSPWLRKTFQLAAAPTEARAYVNVAGYEELYVNGAKVGTDVLSPAVSDYAARTFYVTYDIAPYLRPGQNCVAVWLGRGWFDPDAAYHDPSRGPGPRARIQCEMEIAGGRLTVGSDATWKAAASPYTTIGLYKWCENSGERYDARLANPQWNMASYDDRRWENAREAPALRAEAQSCPLNRIGRRFTPQTVTALGDGRYEIDFGTDLSGGFVFRFPRLEKGRQVVFRFADAKRNRISDEGNPAEGAQPVVPGSFKAGAMEDGQGHPVAYQFMNQYDVYIASGGEAEVFETKFNYHGFRYVVAEGLPSEPKTQDAEARLIESDLDGAGYFQCSNPLYNSIHELNRWTLRCLDLGGYLVDCPHRERLGYGDHQVSVESCIMTSDMAAFYRKWTRDWRDGQNPATGALSNSGPRSYGGGGPPWGGALQAIAWRQYLYYGDRRALEENFDACLRHLQSMEILSRAETPGNDPLIHFYGGQWGFLGDWVAPHRGMDTNNWPPRHAAELFTNCYRIMLLDQLAKIAVIIGRPDDGRRLEAKVAMLRPLVHAAFFDPAMHYYALDEECYQVMPLLAGIVPAELRPEIQRRLEDEIRTKNHGHFDTGMYGTYFLIQYLQAAGRNDLIDLMMSQTTYPGWGWMLAQGATTSWEQWDGYWSHIHSCFTSAASWFYQGLAGIQADPSAPGFKRIVIAPGVVPDVRWVKAHHDSPYGRIGSEWTREGDRFTLDITIPPNTSATVSVPGRLVSGPDGPRVSENPSRYEGPTRITTVTAGSGHYRFESILPP